MLTVVKRESKLEPLDIKNIQKFLRESSDGHNDTTLMSLSTWAFIELPQRTKTLFDSLLEFLNRKGIHKKNSQNYPFILNTHLTDPSNKLSQINIPTLFCKILI